MRCPRYVVVLLGSLALSILSASAPVVAESSSGLPLTFGRCGPEENQCPRTPEKSVTGDATFQSELLSCFSAELKRPVYAWVDAAAPSGLFIDASILGKKSSGDQTMVVLVLHRDNSDNTISLVDDILTVFGTPNPPDAAYYRKICREFSEEIRNKLP